MFGRKGDVGIGTLILFIAFILVASVAAGVVISTTNLLQSKALTTGTESTKEVATSFETISAYAMDGSDDRYIEQVYWTVKPSSGNDDVDFDDLLLTMNTNNQSQEYSYDSSVNCSDSTNVSSYTNKFGITMIIEATNSLSGYFVKGDIVQFCFKAPRAIAEGEKVKLNLIPKKGSTLTENINMPSLMIDQRIYIYP